ncbi:sensor domain-containing protein [Neobacillus drentensis]|uniref:sensor domain-containing protein n=1 Tax=Neobacillus drentensis TaxID=220684 RepID=UPI002862E6B8|nr:EAL domain-containing protein [Neobacillus drentensis]MDR7239554.1 diguanylate cyclase (GGDEF)-like protein/PAS domain S-box-containing protein [Neobacillus drentensis]
MKNQGKSTDLGLFIQTFKSVLLNLPVPCYILDLEGTVVFANDATIQLTGYQREIDFKRSFLSQLDDEYIDKTIEHIKTVLNGERLQVQIEIRHHNKKNIPVDIVSIPLEIRGLVQGICGFILDQSEKSAVIHRLYDPSNWDKILSEIDICLWSVDAKTMETLQISSACQRILGYSEEDFVQNPYLWMDILHPLDKPDVLGQLSLLDKGQSIRLEYRIRTHDGIDKWIIDYIVPIFDELAIGPVRFDRVLMDIDRRKRTEAELTYLAFHDPLTGLPNRREFDEQLHTAILEAKRHRQFVGILFIDIDRFKDINDSLGHKMGDQLIKIIANRLKNHIRTEDVIARQGGDEFVILLKNLPNGQMIEEMAAKICRVVAEPITLLEHEYRMSVSIGTSIFPDHGQDGEVLMMRADHAMYLAKENRTGIQQYQLGMSKSLSRKMLLEQYLHKAIEQNELYLEYQPIFDVFAKKAIGLEALLRWKHPILGSIPPVEFIQIAEESDLIIKLSNWVLSAVCSQRRLWLDKDFSSFYISINVPARQIHQDDFIESIKRSLEQYNLPPELLKIEITERTAMTNVEKTLKTMRELQEYGVDIILDDFGIGYSSISYLVQYPFSTIKIDKSFIQGLGNKSQKSVCRALVAMGRNLGMNVVAEGVEEIDQYHYLCSIGCHKIQGYYFSRPTSVDLVEKFF